MNGRRLQLFRVLLPSWKFFDDPGEMPELYCRWGLGNAELGEWQPCLERPAHTAGTIFFNPYGNYLLACRTLVEQFLSDLADWDERDTASFDSSVSFRLVTNLARYQIAGRLQQNCSFRYQFKIASTPPGEEGERDVLISPIFTQEAV